MGYGFDAINVVRNNRSLLKRRKFKDIKNQLIEATNKNELEFKKVTSEELARIRTRIRKDARRKALKEIIFYGSLAFILFSLMLYLTYQIVKS